MSGNSFSKSQSCVIMDTDSLESLILSDPFFADPTRGNVTSTPRPFTFGPQFLVAQTQTFIDENLVSPGKYTDSGFKFLSLFLFGKIL